MAIRKRAILFQTGRANKGILIYESFSRDTACARVEKAI